MIVAETVTKEKVVNHILKPASDMITNGTVTVINGAAKGLTYVCKDSGNALTQIGKGLKSGRRCTKLEKASSL